MAGYFQGDELAPEQYADEELARRELALKSAIAASQSRLADSGRSGLTESQKERTSAALAEALQQEQRAAESLRHGRDQHPGNRLNKILQEAKGVRAPAMSSVDWWRQNPSILTAVPRSQEERDERERTAYILRRIHEESADSGGPLSWNNYRFSQGVSDLEVEAARGLGVHGVPGSGNAAAVRSWTAPYKYRPWFQTEDGEWLQYYDKDSGAYPILDDVAALGATAAGSYAFPSWPLYAGAYRAADNFVDAGDKLARGRVGEAAKSAAYAIPGIVSPSFHVAGPGMEGDWRQKAGPWIAGTADLAMEAAMLAAAPRLRRLPQSTDKIRQLQGELRDAYHRASRVAHPDVGGSEPLQQLVNRAFESGDRAMLERIAAGYH